MAVTIAAAKHFLNGAGAVRVHGGGFAGTCLLYTSLLTAFAGSIGIIGIALIISLSTGVNKYIADMERDTDVYKRQSWRCPRCGSR